MSRLRSVVDIGSNSVRLVTYDGPARAPFPIVNDKSLCGLGAGVARTGRLDPGAKAEALQTLARFRLQIDEMGVHETIAFATAAIREAEDGAEFVAAARDAGFNVEILSGEDEARAAAFGVLSAEPFAAGLVGDLGGGSLELIAVEAGEIGARTSLKLGALRLQEECAGDMAAVERRIAEDLASVEWLGGLASPTLYTVGGAWRAIARAHMAMADYPLSVLHHYTLTRDEALATCDHVIDLTEDELRELPGVPRKRAPILAYAAAALKGVIEASSACASIVSAAGAREGVLYERLTAAERAEDPLIEGARHLAGRLSPAPAFGEACVAAVSGLFPDETRDERRSRIAATLMADVGALFHPDARAAFAFETAIAAPFMGVGHAERVFIALALYRRHGGRRAGTPDRGALSLLPERRAADATRLGLALRLLGVVAPKSAAARDVRLSLADGRLTVSAPGHLASAFGGETAKKRLASLAEACEADARLAFA